MPNPCSRTLDIRGLEGLAVCLAAPLLALALTHCGGQANDSHAANGGESVGGKSSSEPSNNGGSTVLGGAGLANAWLDAGIVIPVGGAPASLPRDCNGLSYTAPRVPWAIAPGNPPTAKGGAISNGTYHLTKREDFVGPGAATSVNPSGASSALVISASTGVSADMQISWLARGGELPLSLEETRTIVVTGTSYTYAVTCTTDVLAAASGSVSFTATMDELICIYPVTGGATRVETFERD